MVAKARLRPMRGLKAPRIRRGNLSARVAAASPPDTATTPFSQRPTPELLPVTLHDLAQLIPERGRAADRPAGPAWSTFGGSSS